MKSIKILIHERNSYFSFGLINALKDSLREMGLATYIIEPQDSIYADFIFQHYHQGVKACFCNCYHSHNRNSPLFFSIRTPDKSSNNAKLTPCLLERGVINQDISVSSAIDIVINGMNNKIITTKESNYRKVYFSNREIDIFRGFKKVFNM
jgi:hypothetical protein